MSSSLAFFIVGGYFVLLLVIARLTSKDADTEVFFTAKRQSPWYVVAFGMIGASLSGITFISVPGEVGNSQFLYFQMVLGYLLGYLIIGTVLLPLYYKLNLTSIYTYLESRFGFWSYKTGAFYFLLSRTIGASFRLFLVAAVLQLALFEDWDVPFGLTVIITIALIWVYTFRGGIKTIVWTDTFQTFFMLLAVIVTIVIIAGKLDTDVDAIPTLISESSLSHMFNWDWQNNRYFWKQFISGAFIAVVMTGLDQDMMQKNLTCRSLSDAQKNMFWFSIILVFANLLFLALGALLYIFAEQFSIAIPERTDMLFPELAINHLGIFAGVTFLLGITAAAYSSADSALTSLTTSFCVDFLNFNKGQKTEQQKNKVRTYVHLGFSALLFLVIMIFKWLNDDSVINSLFAAAGYTYGPLLGMFAFGIYTKNKPFDRYVPVVALISPILSFFLKSYSKEWFWGYDMGFEVLLVNGFLTFVGLLILSKYKPGSKPV